jgi:hypothetical protein
VVAACVEVAKVERVAFNLPKRLRTDVPLPNLELQNKNEPLLEQYDVSASAESRYRKFEADSTVTDASELLFQEIDRPSPSCRLLDHQLLSVVGG